MTPPCHVLVTRPEGQQQRLVSALEQAGYRVSHQPALEIVALAPTSAERQSLLDIDQYHAVIFISRNAAELGVAQLQDYWPQWPVDVQWLAVGDATAQELIQAGLTPQRPAAGFNSEALLAMPCLQADALRHQRVLLVRGEGGREVLAPVLRERAERLDEIVLYRRQCPASVVWPDAPVDVVMITSQQSWECMASAVPKQCCVLAGSERIAGLIRDQGFTVHAAASPHDDDMLAALAQL